jgi:uncharacterized spore protein YtfJ
MDVRDILMTGRGAMSATLVFGEPFTKDGVTVIPAARVWGGAGGGDQPRSKSAPGGHGGGFGVKAKPAGAYVIRGQKVQWMPAVDVNQIVLGCQALAVALLLLRLRRRRRRHGRPHHHVGVEPAFHAEAAGAPGLPRPDGLGGPPVA